MNGNQGRGDGYYPGQRFNRPIVEKQYRSPYDMSSDEMQDLVSRNESPFFVQTLNLGVAQDTPLLIAQPGQAVVIYGSDGTPARAVNTTAFVAIQFNQWNAGILDDLNVVSVGGPNRPFGFPMKHARGFRGPFKQFYLTWPAQTAGGGGNVYADLIVLKSCEMPWIDGEAAT